jgi:hypothetical protein
MDIKRKHQLIIILAIFGGVVLFVFIFMWPVWGRIRSSDHERRLVEEQLAVSRAEVASARKLQFNGPLLSREKISLAMDEITKTGKAFNISFSSISPQELEDIKDSACQRLPVVIESESEYKDFGLFLGALADLKESIVTVRNFKMTRDEAILPRVRSKLVIDLYLERQP